MSAPRPITRALNELRKCAEEIRTSHTVDGKWPASEAEAHMEYLRLLCIIKAAKKEWADTRERSLRLSMFESPTGNVA